MFDIRQKSPVIEVSNLSLELGGKTRLRAISTRSFSPGITLVMGPNGAGKSLFLKCLHGLIQPTQGLIRFRGQPQQESDAKQAMVFQKATLLRRSVIQNLELMAPADTSRTQIEQLLEEVHLADKARHPARLLSGGEQQRLALARALLTKPEFLFLDEPTASLDPASVLIIERLIQRAKDAGVKVVFVSHDLGQARRLASEILFLHQGRLAEHTHADTFFTAPQSKEAQAYIAGELLL